MPNPWETMLAAAKSEINPQTFSTWLRPTRFAGLNGDGTLRVRVPNHEFKAYITEHFSTLLASLLPAHARTIEFFHEAPAAVAEPEPEAKPAPAAKASHCPAAPEEAWYGAAKLYREILGPRVESSDNFHLACFLTLVGAALGKSVSMNVSKMIYPNLFTVLVGDSAWGRKGVAMAPLLDLAPEINPGVIPFSSVDSSEGLIRAIKEAVEQATEAAQSTVLITLDEFNAMLAKAKQKGSKIIPDLKRAFDCPPTLEINTSINRVRIPKPPAISIIAASEPDDLSDMQDRDIKGGLGNRLVFVPGESKPPNSRSMQPSAEDWLPLSSQLRQTLKFYADRGSTQLYWSQEAFEAWDRFYNSARKRGSDDPLVSKLAARHCVYVPKTAMIFAALDRAERYVEVHHVRAAVAWCDFLLDSLYWVFRNADVKPWVRESKDIVEYVERKGDVTLRSLRNRFHRLGAETFERRMKYILADEAHPERELRREARTGLSGRPTVWVVPND